MWSKHRMRHCGLIVGALALSGCLGPTHFKSRTGRVLETVTAVGAATAGEAASRSRNDLQPMPPLVP